MGFLEEKFSNETGIMSTSCLSSNGYLVKSGKTQLLDFNITNTTDAQRYVKIYDVSAAVNVGTDIPRFRTSLTAGSSQHFTPVNGITFYNGMNVVATSTAGDTSSGAVAAGDVFGFFAYN